jgi:hypothetical protein
MRLIGTFTLGLFISLSLAASAITVSYNKSSGKYHFTSCKWAKKCNKHCIEIPLEEAIKKGGTPCKICRPPFVNSKIIFSDIHENP